MIYQQRTCTQHPMVLMIAYELHRPGQHYSDLYEEIKKVSNGLWWHYLTSHWLIETHLSPQQVWERLAAHVDKNDSVLVMRVTNSPSASGWLPQDAWNWLNARTY